jgi:hypothetical protein
MPASYPKSEWGRVIVPKLLITYWAIHLERSEEFLFRDRQRREKYYTVTVTHLPAEGATTYGVQILTEDTAVVTPKCPRWNQIWKAFLKSKRKESKETEVDEVEEEEE